MRTFFVFVLLLTVSSVLAGWFEWNENGCTKITCNDAKRKVAGIEKDSKKKLLDTQAKTKELKNDVKAKAKELKSDVKAKAKELKSDVKAKASKATKDGTKEAKSFFGKLKEKVDGLFGQK